MTVPSWIQYCHINQYQIIEIVAFSYINLRIVRTDGIYFPQIALKQLDNPTGTDYILIKNNLEYIHIVLVGYIMVRQIHAWCISAYMQGTLGGRSKELWEEGRNKGRYVVKHALLVCLIWSIFRRKNCRSASAKNIMYKQTNKICFALIAHLLSIRANIEKMLIDNNWGHKL